MPLWACGNQTQDCVGPGPVQHSQLGRGIDRHSIQVRLCWLPRQHTAPFIISHKCRPFAGVAYLAKNTSGIDDSHPQQALPWCCPFPAQRHKTRVSVCFKEKTDRVLRVCEKDGFCSCCGRRGCQIANTKSVGSSRIDQRRAVQDGSVYGLQTKSCVAPPAEAEAGIPQPSICCHGTCKA